MKRLETVEVEEHRKILINGFKIVNVVSIVTLRFSKEIILLTL